MHSLVVHLGWRMTCNEISFIDFKGFQNETIPLSPITVLVGGNNAGKSSVLQGFHFGTGVLQARRLADANTFLSSDLRYCPTSDFLELKRVGRLTEGSGLEIKFAHATDVARRFCDISVRRGRNGAVGLIVRSSDPAYLDRLSNVDQPYSIYVPGLSGLPLSEEYKSSLVVDNGIARGDANLYLRNILYRISQSEGLNRKFHELLGLVFEGLTIQTDFRENDHLTIQSVARKNQGPRKPIDLLGTGALQAIQLIAYVVKYSPSMLLLDEPDAHLHPNNQRALCRTLRELNRETGVQILIATHSKHFVDEFINSPNASVVWLKDRRVQRDKTKSQIAILTDLGALDEGSRVLHRDCRVLVWTEDSEGDKNQIFLKSLLEANGFREGEYAILSYNTSNKIEAALMLARFVSEAHQNLRILIHRDRDFMTNEEVEQWTTLYRDKGVLNDSVELFFTRGSDIESYFCSVNHLTHVFAGRANAEQMISEIIQQNQVAISTKFTRKRDDIKGSRIYAGRQNDCPSVEHLIADGEVGSQHCVGKWMLKRLREVIAGHQDIHHDELLGFSPNLEEPQISQMAVDVWGNDEAVV